MIYYVEDDENIRALVVYTLNQVGLEAQGFSCARDFYGAMEKREPDLILLDIMLPEEDGLTILRKLRADPDAQEIPVIRSQQDVCRVACSRPGMYVPRERIGTHVQAGDTLGVIVDALHGEAVEEVKAPEGGLVFSQRCYSAVYPGTMIARLCRREQA